MTSVATETSLRVERVPSLDALRGDWQRLASVAPSPFSTWEWGAAWWKAFGRGRELFLHACRRPGGEVVAVLPLYLATRRGPCRVARFVGHGPADQLGPVCAAGDRPAVAEALRSLAREELGRAGMLIADRMPRDEGWPSLLRARELHREATPKISIAGITWEEWLAGKSRNFRDQVGRRERKLAREHRVVTRLVTDPDEVPDAYEKLVQLHEARWGGASRTFAGPRRDFHADFLSGAAARGWARLWLLEVDGQAVAAWYGWRFGEADWYYQAGRAPALERENVGFVLLCHTIRDAFVAGRREYRFLLGDDPYKSRFQTDDPELATLALSAGPGAVAAQAAAVAGRSLPQRARRSLRRLAS
jgi:CelD/BcsL family acetyltransferase involved in cellulose biosynthesis